MANPSPLTSLSLSLQNTKQKSPVRVDHYSNSETEPYETEPCIKSVSHKMSTHTPQDASEDDEFHDTHSNAPASPYKSAVRRVPVDDMSSPIKYESQSPRPSTNGSSSPAMSSSPESPLRFNQGLTRTIASAQSEEADEGDTTLHRADEGMSTIMHDKPGANADHAGQGTDITLGIDDTMNNVSTFSAIPDADLTRFAAQRNAAAASPTRYDAETSSPSKQLRNPVAATPGTVKRPLQLLNRSQSDNNFDDDVTPRRPYSTSSPDDLLNFTGQPNLFIPPPQSAARNGVRRSPSGRGGFPIRVNPSPTHRSQASVDRERSRGVVSPPKQAANTPATERRANLLDFDLEPLATPRSIPSITPRELESLRSELSSQISSLSATLSGKEAEVQALKRAITDAEVRVGNTSEELRNEKSLRESLEHEQQEWDRRGREMETVLREIRQEIMVGEHERDKLRRQTEEAERRSEEMEIRVVELQTRLESANRRATLSPTGSPTKEEGSLGDPAMLLVNRHGMDIDEAVREATEQVARDLHALYKSKHESKVAALKKSYEARWEKKVRHLEDELKSANTEIVDLKTQRDATMTGPLAASASAEQQQLLLEDQTRLTEQLIKDKELLEAEKQMLAAQAEGLQSEIQSVKQQSEHLREQLEKERREKGELVAQVDLFLALGDDAPPPPPPPSAQKGSTTEARVRSVSSDSATPSCLPASSRSLDYPSPSLQSSPARPAGINARNGAATGSARPRPMSMLQQPGKFSGIPGPGGGGSRGIGAAAAGGKGLPPLARPGAGLGIMEGIAKMGAGVGSIGGNRGY